MSSFEYLAILVSVVLGLAIARLTAKLSQSIKRKTRVQSYWVQRVWTFNIWLYVLGIWWGMVSWDRLEEWTFFLFLFIMLYATVIFLLADALYPDDMAPGTNLEEYFFAHRRWFFGLLVLTALVDIPETMLKEILELRPAPDGYLGLVAFWLVTAAVGMLTENRKVHAVLAIAWPVVTLGYVSQALFMLWGG